MKWIEVKDGNRDAREIFDRHYSRIRYKDGRKPKLFVGPGYKIVLITEDLKCLFVWRSFIDSCKISNGVNCSIFRNESDRRSSDLILEAERVLRNKWKDTKKVYTYVNHSKIRSNNPGFCFIKAGWKRLRIRTKKSKLYVLEKEF